MFMNKLACAAITAAAFAGPAYAHGFAGDRFFPATIATDDPAVADELSLPTVSYQDGETDVAGEWSKRITRTLGVSFGETWTHAKEGAGFQNLETSLKWQFLTNAPHEAILAAGIETEWGGSGAARVGAEDTTTIAPTFYFGKGFGDTPLSYIRPFAVTGVVGYAIPTRGHNNSGDPNTSTLDTGLSVQYSLPYLAAHVRDMGWPRWVNQLTPLVEVSFEDPLHNGENEPITGSIDPGVIWSGRHIQIGAEANIPMNDDSGRNVGVTVQAHFYLDDIFPHSIGRPILGGSR